MTTIVGNLGAIPSYRQQHRAIFGRDVDPDGVADAIAAYVRTILSGNSPYDRFKAGDVTAMSVSASSDIRPLGLNAREQADLVAFMQALTGEIDPDVSRPPTLPE